MEKNCQVHVRHECLSNFHFPSFHTNRKATTTYLEVLVGVHGVHCKQPTLCKVQMFGELTHAGKEKENNKVNIVKTRLLWPVFSHVLKFKPQPIILLHE